MRTTVKITAYGLLLATSVGLALLLYVLLISWPVYQSTKHPHHYTSNLYEADSALGYRIKPNTQGHFVWSFGDSVAINANEVSCRVEVPSAANSQGAGGWLYLGDSFTFGEELPYSETYPALVQQALGKTASNAAVSGYGYTQMIKRAESLISYVQPEVIIFQVSPWLADRAIDRYMPAPFFKIPVPFYNTDGTIESPSFDTPVFQITQDTLLDGFRSSDASVIDFWRFVQDVTWPIYKNEIPQRVQLQFADTSPLEDRDKATAITLEKMVELGKGRTVVLLLLGFTGEQLGETQRIYADLFERNENLIALDTDSVLYAQPGIKTRDDFEKAYNFWHGSPAELIDYHYNAKAHQLIADALLKRLTPKVTESISAEPIP